MCGNVIMKSITSYVNLKKQFEKLQVWKQVHCSLFFFFTLLQCSITFCKISLLTIQSLWIRFLFCCFGGLFISEDWAQVFVHARQIVLYHWAKCPLLNTCMFSTIYKFISWANYLLCWQCSHQQTGIKFWKIFHYCQIHILTKWLPFSNAAII